VLQKGKKAFANVLIFYSLVAQLFTPFNLAALAEAPPVVRDPAPALTPAPKKIKQSKKIKIKSIHRQAKRRAKIVVGKASWYGGGSRNYALTAAMRTFRGRMVKVINMTNKKSVVVRINDHGPARWTGRVIDLSRASFAKIASTNQGVIPKVKLYVY